MKQLFLLLICIFFLSALNSCASSPKKRKGCKGNGSWYGKRNLGEFRPKTMKQGDYTVYIQSTETSAF